MKAVTNWKANLLFIVGSCSVAYAGIQSSLLGTVQKLPVEIRTVTTCGEWEYEGKSGYYRLVIGDVYHGAGTEVYVQWVIAPTQDKSQEVLTTLAFPELNDDHAQYYFETAECLKVGRNQHIKLKGSYEHDEVDREHEITIRLINVGRYELRERVKGKPEAGLPKKKAQGNTTK